MTPDNRITFDGPELDEIYVAGANVHLENLGNRNWMLIIHRGEDYIHLSLHGQVTVYEVAGMDDITTVGPPLLADPFDAQEDV